MIHKFWKLTNVWCRSPEINRTMELQTLLNDPKIMCFNDNGYVSLEECRKICSGKFPWFFIYSMESVMIGAVALLRSDGESAEVCIMIKQKWRRMGIGTDVLERLCDAACLSFGLKRLYARVLTNNTNAINFFKKREFVCTNSLPQHVKVPRELESIYFMRDLQTPSLSLSVIIPVHNCEKWIAQCIDSISEIPCQIIVVDDASDDRTLEIVERLESNDKRIKLLRLSERCFAGGARNAGLAEADGEYVFFLDGDDILCDHSVCRRMFMAACMSRADVICTSEVEFFDDKKSWRLQRGGQYTGVVGSNVRTMMLANQRPVWMCWFRREYVEKNELRFAEGVRSYEDNLFTFISALTVGSMVTVPGVLVSHRIRIDSLSHVPDSHVQTAFFDVVDMQLDYAKSVGVYSQMPEMIERCFFHSVFLTAFHVWKMLKDREDWIIVDALDFLKTKFPDMLGHIDCFHISNREKDMFVLAWTDMEQFFVRFGDIR